MPDFQHKLGDFRGDELNILFHNLLRSISDQADHGSEEHKKVAEQISALLDSQIGSLRRVRQEAEDLKKNVHVVFSLSDAGSLKVSLSELGKRQENEVLAFDDLFSVGTITQLLNETGQRRRQHWMTERFFHDPIASLHNREHRIGPMIEAIARIPESKSVTVWCANNSHDQLGLRLVAYLLRNREQPVRVMNASNACKLIDPAYREGSAYAQGMIEKEIYRAIVSRCEEATKLTSGERKQYETEWLELSGQEHVLRLWENGRIEGADENALDNAILNAIDELQAEETADGGYVKAGRVVVRMFENMHQLVGDRFLSYRMWRLISEGIVGFKGLPGQLHTFSVKKI